MLESLLNKVVGLKPSFTKHLRWLLLESVCEGTSLVKILQVTDASERCPLRKKNEKRRLLKRLPFLLFKN